MDERKERREKVRGSAIQDEARITAFLFFRMGYVNMDIEKRSVVVVGWDGMDECAGLQVSSSLSYSPNSKGGKQVKSLALFATTFFV